MRRLGPAALVAVVAAGMCAAGHTPAGDLLRYSLYLGAFVIGPGWLAWRGLAGDAPGGALRQLVLGWALGLALIIAGGLLTAAIGARWLLWAEPLLVAAAAGPRGWRHRHAAAVEPWTLRRPVAEGWAVAGVIAVALVYLAAAFYTQKPMPGHFANVSYSADTVYTLALAGEARHQWPIHNPSVAGTPLPYHVFAHVEMAAANQLTGVPLLTMVMRFAPAALFVLLALGAALAARAFTRGAAWAGVVAPALVLLVGEADPFSNSAYPFANTYFLDLYLSPTFLLGAAVFLPALVLLREVLVAPMRRPGLWAALAMLLFACGGAKATILPVVGGATGLLLLWCLARERAIAPRAFAALALTSGLFGMFYLALYAGRSGGFTVSGLWTLRHAEKLAGLEPHLPHGVWLVAVAVLGTLGFAGPQLVGVAGLLRRSWRPDAGEVLLLAACVIAFGPLYVLSSVDASELYLVWFGLLAGTIAATAGVVALAGRMRSAGRARILGAGVAAFVLVGAMDQPLDIFPTLIKRRQHHEVLYSNHDVGLHGMTSGLYEGLRWVRAHTSPKDVLATNIHTLDQGYDSRYFYISAFTERRVFLESWLYTSRTAAIGYVKVANGQLHPFPDRLALNTAVFDRADRAAMADLRRRYGVTRLVVVKLYGLGAPAVAAAGKPLFENADVAVYANPA